MLAVPLAGDGVLEHIELREAGEAVTPFVVGAGGAAVPGVIFEVLGCLDGAELWEALAYQSDQPGQVGRGEAGAEISGGEAVDSDDVGFDSAVFDWAVRLRGWPRLLKYSILFSTLKRPGTGGVPTARTAPTASMAGSALSAGLPIEPAPETPFTVMPQAKI